MKRNVLWRYVLTGLLSIGIMVTLTACAAGDEGNKDNSVTSEVVEQTEVEETEEAKQSEETTEVVEESTEEVEPSTEVVEDPTANLSNEEWVETLNIDKATLIVFNEITGERKVLENNQDYILVEGDEIGFKCPKGGMPITEEIPGIVIDNVESKNRCVMYYINFDSITERTEFTRKCKDKSGEIQSATVYLSK